MTHVSPGRRMIPTRRARSWASSLAVWPSGRCRRWASTIEPLYPDPAANRPRYLGHRDVRGRIRTDGRWRVGGEGGRRAVGSVGACSTHVASAKPRSAQVRAVTAVFVSNIFADQKRQGVAVPEDEIPRQGLCFPGKAERNLPLGSRNRGKYVPGMRICEVGRLRSCCVPHNRRRRTRRVGLVNLLTGEEKEHIIDSKGRCGPGEPSWQLLSRLSPRTVRGRSLSPSSRARLLAVPGTRGWGRGSWIAGA